MKLPLSLSAAACCLLAAGSALAARPIGVSTGFERIESISHARVTTKLAGVEQTSSSWRAGLGTTPGNGYSVPRVSLEYSFESGLSLGMAIGFMYSWKDKVGADASVLVLRAGYAFEFGEGFGLWPRLGLTLHDMDPPEATHTALSLDVPFLNFRHELGSITFGPYVDVGLAGTVKGLGLVVIDDGAPPADGDQTISEFGLAFGFQFF